MCCGLVGLLRKSVKKLPLFVAFVATVYGANWAIGRYGIVPIGFGLTAPAGVYFVGLAFGLRDALHELAGRGWVLAAVLCGSALSWALAEAVTLSDGVVLASAGRVALASAVAFGLSELADYALYSPLRERNWPVAVVVSNLAGAVVDSALFLWLAFGSLAHVQGQLVGKAYMIALALPLVWGVRRAVPRYRFRASGA